jgi:TM2 domain-containing membrane protein YozV
MTNSNMRVLAMAKSELKSNELNQFMLSYQGSRKSVSTGVLLALFTGGIGGHKFWLQETKAGVLYALFCWTFIPALLALIDACCMGGSVNKYNNLIARGLIEEIKIMRPNLLSE